MTELVLFRAGRALVVTLSALTLAHLLELSHRLAHDARLWAQLTSPDGLYRYFRIIGGPLAVAAVIAVTVLAMTVGYQRPAGRFALAAAVLHTAALGVWLGVVPADVGSGGWSGGAVQPDWGELARPLGDGAHGQLRAAAARVRRAGTGGPVGAAPTPGGTPRRRRRDSLSRPQGHQRPVSSADAGVARTAVAGTAARFRGDVVGDGDCHLGLLSCGPGQRGAAGPVVA